METALPCLTPGEAGRGLAAPSISGGMDLCICVVTCLEQIDLSAYEVEESMFIGGDAGRWQRDARLLGMGLWWKGRPLGRERLLPSPR